MNLAYFRSLAARFFRRSQTENELEEELRGHIQLRADDLERSGLGRTEAERRARIEFGGHERFKEECRETIAGNFLDILMQDLLQFPDARETTGVRGCRDCHARDRDRHDHGDVEHRT